MIDFAIVEALEQLILLLKMMVYIYSSIKIG